MNVYLETFRKLTKQVQASGSCSQQGQTTHVCEQHTAVIIQYHSEGPKAFTLFRCKTRLSERPFTEHVLCEENVAFYQW